MQKLTVTLIVLLFTKLVFSQANIAFAEGEELKFKLSYSNFFKAGEATLKVKSTQHEGKEAYHIIGKGKTTGMIKWFFEVNDEYQTKFYKENKLPFYFKRKINEGGYKKNKEIFFDQKNNIAKVIDHKHDSSKEISINNVQDMVSSFYYLRNVDFSNYSAGDEIKINMFFDEETFFFKLKLLGREVLSTKFGDIKTLRFRPLVQSGRIFKEQESLTVWVSDDKNKIPLHIQAALSVGSLNANLDSYKGLAYPINFKR